MKRKGQVAVEFMLFVSMGVLLFVVFSIISVNYLQDIYQEKQNINGQDLVNIIRNEINLAGRAEEGYHREYRLPSDVGGLDYEVNIDKREASVEIEGVDYIGRLSTDTGNTVGDGLITALPSKTLIITKLNGEVRITVA